MPTGHSGTINNYEAALRSQYVLANSRLCYSDKMWVGGYNSCYVLTTDQILCEGFADVEISLDGDQDNTVHAPGQRYLHHSQFEQAMRTSEAAIF